MRTIQSKILIVVITALIVITAIVTSIATGVTHRILLNDAQRILDLASEKEAAHINEMLGSFMKSSAIIEHIAASELEDPNMLRDKQYIDMYLWIIQQIFNEIAINTTGANSYYFCISPDLTDESCGFYSQFEADGSLYKLSDNEFNKLTLITPEEITEYYELRGRNIGRWLEPHPSRFTGDTVISYIFPVFIDEIFIGIVGFNMNFDYMISLVNEISLYKSGRVLLMSENDSVCYNWDDATCNDDEHLESEAFLLNNMYLRIHAESKDIQNDLYPMIRYILLAFLTIFSLAILYTFWVTRRIVKPLNKLTETVNGISSGDYHLNSFVESNDEIGILSKALKDSYSKISEYTAYINTVAYKDSLTGLKNSTAYAEATEKLNNEIAHGKPKFGILVADVNNLKNTNDTYGHGIGNELIIHSAKILADTFRTSTVYRIGGDEFVVILEGNDLECYPMLIKKMDEAFSHEYITVNDDSISVSAARGASVFDSSSDRTFGDVFAKADNRMYLNKQEIKTGARIIPV